MTFQEQFMKLSQLLSESQFWWQFGAFHPSVSRWKKSYPQLDDKLNSERLGYLDFSANSYQSLNRYLEALIPQLKEIQEVIGLPQAKQQLQAPDSHWQYQIAGRKWSQITHFAAHIPAQKHLLEWCSGKGHLGRLGATLSSKSLTSLEWQKSLCEKNRELNKRLNIERDFCPTNVKQCDVLSEQSESALLLKHFAIGLHACGELHTHLVQLVAKNKAQGVCLSPCCYNLISSSHYQPLSTQAKQHNLNLSKLDLALPLRKTVTAGSREKREQARERLWRIGFDCWQREERGVDEYLPLATIPKAILKGEFKDFIQWAAQKKLNEKLAFESNSFDEALVLKNAEKRLPAITQMEWVQNKFQRAIEVWLLLDQVLFLEESGYQCQLFEFCDLQITPRNILLFASK